MDKQEFMNELDSFQEEFISRDDNSYTEKGYYCIHLASFGDYDNSCEIERANQRWLEEHYSEFITITREQFNSQICHITMEDIECLDWSKPEILERAQELIDILCHLTDYPSIDDELASLVAMELQDETWENCYKQDVLRLLDKQFPELELDDLEIDDEKLRELFEQKRESLNRYWEIQAGGNAYINIEFITEAITEEEVENIVKQPASKLLPQTNS